MTIDSLNVVLRFHLSTKREKNNRLKLTFSNHEHCKRHVLKFSYHIHFTNTSKFKIFYIFSYEIMIANEFWKSITYLSVGTLNGDISPYCSAKLLNKTYIIKNMRTFKWETMHPCGLRDDCKTARGEKWRSKKKKDEKRGRRQNQHRKKRIDSNFFAPNTSTSSSLQAIQQKYSQYLIWKS